MIEKITNVRDGDWHRWFAWFPVDTTCGHRAWWEHIERRWDSEANIRCIDQCDPGLPDGGWEYRLSAAQRQEQEGGSHVG